MSSPNSSDSIDASRSIDPCDESTSDKSFDPDGTPWRQEKSYDASILIFESDDEFENSIHERDVDGGDSCQYKLSIPAKEEQEFTRSGAIDSFGSEIQVLTTISAQVANKEIKNLRDVASKEMIRLRSEIEKLTRKNLKLRHALHENEEKLNKSLTLVNRSLSAFSLNPSIPVFFIHRLFYRFKSTQMAYETCKKTLQVCHLSSPEHRNRTRTTEARIVFHHGNRKRK